MKKLVLSLIFALMALGLVSCSSMNKKDAGDMMMEEAAIMYMDITPERAYMMMIDMPELIIVDVSPIYGNGHIKGAVSAYVGDGTLDMMMKKWDKEATYLVYCHTDEASMLGAQKLIDAGFENVYRLQGNYEAWVEAGYPVEM